MTYAVVRVRGTADIHPKVQDTLKMLNLHRPNHCVLVPPDDSYEGMLSVVHDHVTWGEVDADTLADLLEARGRVVGDEPLTDDEVAERSDLDSIQELAEAVAAGKTRLRDVDGLKPVIRLHPPRKGYEGNKRSYGTGGSLGYRGDDINELLQRMVAVQHG